MTTPLTTHGQPHAGRRRCDRCWRPCSHCICTGLAPIPTRTRLVILQHPRERAMKLGTARLAHLAFANATLHVGTSFDTHPAIERALAASDRPALLFPAPVPGGVPTVTEADTLVVVDGTWSQARKIVARSPLLMRLPRLALVPRAPSAYRIRREPAPHCLSTVEAIIAALDALEGAGPRCEAVVAAFHRMIDRQVAHAVRSPRPYRRERKQRRDRRDDPDLQRLVRTWPSLVVVQAEGSPRDGTTIHDLVQLVAMRPATGERFATVVRPRGALHAATPTRLGLPASAWLEAPPRDDALGAWESFLRPDDFVVTWGSFTPAAIVAAGGQERPWIDVKRATGARLGRCGGVEAAARRFGHPIPNAWAPGRGGRRAAALAVVVTALAEPAADRGTPLPGGTTATSRTP